MNYKLRIATAILSVFTGCLLGWSCKLTMDLARSERLEAVGGVETYRSQRVAALHAMKSKINVTDPVVRQAQMDELDRLIGEIDREATEELGGEMKIERVEE